MIRTQFKSDHSFTFKEINEGKKVLQRSEGAQIFRDRKGCSSRQFQLSMIGDITREPSKTCENPVTMSPQGCLLTRLMLKQALNSNVIEFPLPHGDDIPAACSTPNDHPVSGHIKKARYGVIPFKKLLF